MASRSLPDLGGPSPAAQQAATSPGEIALPFVFGGGSVSSAVAAGTLQVSKSTSVGRSAGSALRQRKSLSSTRWRGAASSSQQDFGAFATAADMTLLPSRSAPSRLGHNKGLPGGDTWTGTSSSSRRGGAWRDAAFGQAAQLGTLGGGSTLGAPTLQTRATRMAKNFRPVVLVRSLQQAQADGSLKRLRAAVHEARGAGLGRGNSSDAQELHRIQKLLDTAEHCSRECRDGIADDRVRRVRRAVRTAQFMDLGPGLWEDPWLAQGRERLRAHLRRDKAELESENGRGQKLQEERFEELQQWLLEMELSPSCGTANFGPDAAASCSCCGSRHFWFCHGCSCVQYSFDVEEYCIHGCDTARFGWSCIGSKCAREDCGCQLGTAYWRTSGSIGLLLDRPPAEEESGLEPPPPPPAGGSVPSNLEEMTLRQLRELCEEQGSIAWHRMCPPTVDIMRHLIRLCRNEGVSTAGTWRCLLQRLNWRAFMRGDDDAFDSIREPSMWEQDLDPI